MKLSALPDHARTLRDEARATRHRRALVLAGELDAREAAVAVVAEALGPCELLRVAGAGTTDADMAEGSVRAKDALGREADLTVLDLGGGLDAEALAASHGTVRAGGLFVVLVPPLASWPVRHDPIDASLVVHPFGLADVGRRFVRRFLRTAVESPGVSVAALDRDALRGTPGIPRSGPPSVLPPPTAAPKAATADQERAVASLLELGERASPVVLTSLRGRGKSAALGLAARELASRGRGVILTGPSRAAASIALRFAGNASAEQVRFVEPEEVPSARRPDDVLLVDEAAALALPRLDALLQTGARTAFATTVQGYEGTGRGFAVRFVERLRQSFPDLVEHELLVPIRFAAGDPVESFVHRALLLDAKPAPDDVVAGASVDSVDAIALERDALVANESQLEQLVGLLVFAHYRTTPGDVARFLDAPNLEAYALVHGTWVAGAAVVAREGGFPPEETARIFEGKERPRGHALPETLVCHLGREDAGRLVARRIVRIAIHPAARRRGLGAHLVDAIERDARRDDADYLGSVFAADEELIGFWSNAGFAPVRLSISRGERSGDRSAVVMKPLPGAAERLARELRERFARDLPHALSDPLRDAPPALIVQCLAGSDPKRRALLDDEDLRAVVACAFGPRSYDVTVRPMFELVAAALARGDLPGDESARHLLVSKVLCRRQWEEVARSRGVSVPVAMRALREALRPLVLALGEPARQLAERFHGPG